LFTREKGKTSTTWGRTVQRAKRLGAKHPGGELTKGRNVLLPVPVTFWLSPKFGMIRG